MKNSKVTTRTECAVMVALAFALSCAKLYEMPLGGSVTVASMLPIMLIGVKYGPLVGIGTGFVYSLTQAFQSLLAGNVFPYCETGATLVICVLFDYLVPFTILGLAGIFKNCRFFKNREIALYAGMCATVLVRFLCHFVTGVAIWGQWAPEGMGKYVYSLVYNGTYLLPELGITLIVAVILLQVPQMKKLLKI